MRQTDGTAWRRSGSSLIWAPQLLAPLILDGAAVPLSTVLAWRKDGFPDSPPGARSYVLVGGLQTVLETLMQGSPEAAFAWLRQNMLPLVREKQSFWPGVGLVFGMDGPGKLFAHNEADDLLYFGRARTREGKVCLSRGMWNGAATGEGAFQVVVPETKEIGGYYVQRVS